MDHNPLLYLETANLGVVEQRWVPQLAEFNFEVHYTSGRLNLNADVLSRIPVAPEPEVEDTKKALQRIAYETQHGQGRE